MLAHNPLRVVTNEKDIVVASTKITTVVQLQIEAEKLRFGSL